MRTYEYLTPHMEHWTDLKIVHAGEPVPIDGNGFAAIGRLELLKLLAARCRELGTEVAFEHPVASLDDLAKFDLIVAADGVNSTMRRTHATEFGATEVSLSNRFVWYGTTKVFDCLTLTFRESEHGAFCAHHYRYSRRMSTFIVECDASTWARAEFARMSDAESREYCERVFAPTLEGHPLVSNIVYVAKFSTGPE